MMATKLHWDAVDTKFSQLVQAAANPAANFVPEDIALSKAEEECDTCWAARLANEQKGLFKHVVTTDSTWLNGDRAGERSSALVFINIVSRKVGKASTLTSEKAVDRFEAVCKEPLTKASQLGEALEKYAQARKEYRLAKGQYPSPETCCIKLHRLLRKLLIEPELLLILTQPYWDYKKEQELSGKEEDPEILFGFLTGILHDNKDDAAFRSRVRQQSHAAETPPDTTPKEKGRWDSTGIDYNDYIVTPMKPESFWPPGCEKVCFHSREGIKSHNKAMCSPDKPCGKIVTKANIECTNPIYRHLGICPYYRVETGVYHRVSPGEIQQAMKKIGLRLKFRDLVSLGSHMQFLLNQQAIIPVGATLPSDLDSSLSSISEEPGTPSPAPDRARVAPSNIVQGARARRAVRAPARWSQHLAVQHKTLSTRSQNAPCA